MKTTTKEHDNIGNAMTWTELNERIELRRRELLEQATEAGRLHAAMSQRAEQSLQSIDELLRKVATSAPARWVALGVDAHRFARAQLAELLADAGRVLGAYVDTSTGASVIVYADDTGAHAVTAEAHGALALIHELVALARAAGITAWVDFPDEQDLTEAWRVDAFARGDVELAAIVLRDFGRELVLPVSPTTN